LFSVVEKLVFVNKYLAVRKEDLMTALFFEVIDSVLLLLATMVRVMMLLSGVMMMMIVRRRTS
jgi:hypothetical protein